MIPCLTLLLKFVSVWWKHLQIVPRMSSTNFAALARHHHHYHHHHHHHHHHPILYLNTIVGSCAKRHSNYFVLIDCFSPGIWEMYEQTFCRSVPRGRPTVYQWPRYPFIHLGGERHCESKVSAPPPRGSCPRTQRSSLVEPGPLDPESSALTMVIFIYIYTF